MGGGKAPGPSAAQIQAQETQARLAAAQEAQLAQQETERLATMRARAGRMSGRSLLMLDETGFFTDAGTDGLKKRLGASWRDAPADTAGTGTSATKSSPIPQSLLGLGATGLLRAA